MNHTACVLRERDPRSDPRHAQEGTRLPVLPGTGFWYGVLLHGKNNGAASADHGAAADQHNVHLRTPKHAASLFARDGGRLSTFDARTRRSFYSLKSLVCAVEASCDCVRDG